MSLDRMRKSLKSLLGIQSNPQNEQPSQVSRQSQSEYVLHKSDQIFKNKFVIIQKKEDKLNPYKYAIERLKEYNLTMFRTNDLLNCPIISYKFNKEEKRIHENIVTKPRWKKEESSQEMINIKSDDERKSFFFHASYIKDENRQPSQSKQTAKKSQISQRNSDSKAEYNFEKEKQTVENISKSNKQNVQEDNNQSESESIIIDKKSEPKFRKLKPQPQEIILNKDQQYISGKNEIKNIDDIQTSKKPTVQKKDVQEKLPEIQVSQQVSIIPIKEDQKTEVIENKQQQIIEPQVEQKIVPQISNQEQITPDINPFTQNIENQLFNPPWLDNPIQQQNQVSFNLFQQPLIQQQQPQMQPLIMQPLQFQNPIQQQSQNLFPFQNQQTQNVFSNQNLFNQQPNLFQNNQQSQQSFNLFNQTNQFQQQPLFQQQSTQSLFQQQPTSSESFFQQQPSAISLFQQQPQQQQQQLFQQQPSTQSIFQQQQSSNNLFTSQPQNQLFQQPNQQTTNLFANNDQKQNVVDLFSAQSVQNTPNLFQQNQVQNQESLFSLNTQQQSNNTAQQRAYSHSDRYKKNLSKYTTERIE